MTIENNMPLEWHQISMIRRIAREIGDRSDCVVSASMTAHIMNLPDDLFIAIPRDDGKFTVSLTEGGQAIAKYAPI